MLTPLGRKLELDAIEALEENGIYEESTGALTNEMFTLQSKILLSL